MPLQRGGRGCLKVGDFHLMALSGFFVEEPVTGSDAQVRRLRSFEAAASPRCSE